MVITKMRRNQKPRRGEIIFGETFCFSFLSFTTAHVNNLTFQFSLVLIFFANKLPRLLDPVA